MVPSCRQSRRVEWSGDLSLTLVFWVQVCWSRLPRSSPAAHPRSSALRCSFEGATLACTRPAGRKCPRQRTRAVAPLALVSVEFNPALLLGLGVITGGLALYQLRQREAAISRDKDLFISCVCLCSGGILVFQVRAGKSLVLLNTRGRTGL